MRSGKARKQKATTRKLPTTQEELPLEEVAARRDKAILNALNSKPKLLEEFKGQSLRARAQEKDVSN